MNLGDKQLASIRAEINKAAIDHLQARDADTAMSHYADDVVAVSNSRIFLSRMELAADVQEFYDILQEINEAAWHNNHIVVIDDHTATFTAEFRYKFTSKVGEITRLEGVWTAVFVRHGSDWKIRVRHESFVLG